jgi:hypothetical protein
MNRKACVDSMVTRRQVPGDDGFVLLELGDILTPDVANDAEAEPSFATGSNIHMLDGGRRAEPVRVTPPDDIDQALIAYLLDLDPPT